MIDYEVIAKEGSHRYPNEGALKIQPALNGKMFIAFHDDPRYFLPKGSLVIKRVGDLLSRSLIEEALSPLEKSTPPRPNVFIDLVPSRENTPDRLREHLVQGFYIPIPVDILYQGNIENNFEHPVRLSSPFTSQSLALKPSQLVSVGGIYRIEAKSQGHLFHRVRDEYHRFVKKSMEREKEKEKISLEINAVMPLGDFIVHNEDNYEVLLFGHYKRR